LPSRCISVNAERFFDRNLRVDAVQLVKVDAFELEPLEATLEAGAQPFRPRVDRPLIRTRAREPGFGRDHDALAIRRERLRDDLFADVGPVRIGRIDEVHAALDDVADQFDGGGPIGGRPPDSIARNLHGAEAQPPDGQISADGDVAAQLRGSRRSTVHVSPNHTEDRAFPTAFEFRLDLGYECRMERER
jgi:hypothetical protein